MSSVSIPSETLSSAVHKVRNIAEKIYILPAPPPVDPVVPLVPGAVAQVPVGAPLVPGAAAAVVVRDIHPIVNRILINAIISFTNDEIAVPLHQEVMNDSANSRLRDYSYYLRDAMSAEIRLNSFPSLPLKYSRKLPGVKSSISSLNSMVVPETHPCFRVPPSGPSYNENRLNGVPPKVQTSALPTFVAVPPHSAGSQDYSNPQLSGVPPRGPHVSNSSDYISHVPPVGNILRDLVKLVIQQKN